MRPIAQHEAETMREALRTIARFRNEAQNPQEPGQAAANLARDTLEDLKLYFQKDALPGDSASGSQDQ